MNVLDLVTPGFINSHLFEEQARHFMKHGSYTNAPKGTFAYREFWNEQTRRCKEGYSVGGIRLTGEHYFYLNFSQIKATVT